MTSKALIIGAGAIGGFYGPLPAKAGADVVRRVTVQYKGKWNTDDAAQPINTAQSVTLWLRLLKIRVNLSNPCHPCSHIVVTRRFDKIGYALMKLRELKLGV